jgi:hypothetical protein
LRRCQAIDLALDGKQGIDALHRLNGDWRLVESGELRRAFAQHAASMIEAALRRAS